MSPEVPPPSESIEPPARRLSGDLRDILREANGHAVTLGQLEEILQGRGFALFILLLSLPFLFPIAVPGLSVPFGIVIMLLGMRIATGQKPSLPRFILKRELKYSTLERMVSFGLKMCQYMEKIVRPRMDFLQRWPGMKNLIGIGIASGGIQLLLPLPPLIPFSNFIPAVSVVLLTAGLSERDGLMVLSGYIVNILAWIYFFIMFAVAGDGIRWIWHHIPWWN
ncbi:exopolysaccharide biosynthesis protein [Verrucomicrobiota bacterium sgz303538]